MSIRFPLSLSAPNTTILPTVSDLFDPRLHTCYFSESSPLSVEQYISILNILMSKENLSQYENFKILMFSRTPTEEEHNTFLEITNFIPDDRRWLLALMGLSGHLYSDEARLYFHVPRRPSLDGLYLTFSQEAFPESTLNISEFENFFNEAYLKWTTVFDRHGYDKKIVYHTFNTPHRVIGQLLSFISGISFFNDTSTEIPYSATGLLQELQNNPEATLKTTYNERNARFNFTIKFPINRTSRRQLYTIRSYSTNPMDYLTYPNMEKKEKDPVLVGVELEVSTDYTMQQLVDACNEPFFIGKEDSSISRTRATAVELVTAPCSFKYLKRQYALWFNNLDYAKFDVTTETNNGMHVHVGREHFEDNYHIRNFCWFFNNPANSNFMVYISERGTFEAMQRYSPIYQFPTSTSRTRAFKDIYRIIGQGHRGITNFKGGWANATTVEVRMFRGIVSYAAIVKNLEFVESVFYFSKSLTSYRQLSLSGYLKWLKNTPVNKYTLLKKFIEQGDIDKMLLAAEIRDIIFNETNEEKIVSLLKHSGIRITNAHIQYLNRGKKRTFVLNKETNEIEIIYNNRSKLEPFNRSFAERYLRNTNAA